MTPVAWGRGAVDEGRQVTLRMRLVVHDNAEEADILIDIVLTNRERIGWTVEGSKQVSARLGSRDDVHHHITREAG